jgi:hypothetical protein
VPPEPQGLPVVTQREGREAKYIMNSSRTHPVAEKHLKYYKMSILWRASNISNGLSLVFLKALTELEMKIVPQLNLEAEAGTGHVQPFPCLDSGLDRYPTKSNRRVPDALDAMGTVEIK